MTWPLLGKPLFRLLNLVANGISVWLARCEPFVAWTLEQLKRGTNANVDLLDVPPWTTTGTIMDDKYPSHGSDNVTVHIEVVYPAKHRETENES